MTAANPSGGPGTGATGPRTGAAGKPGMGAGSAGRSKAATTAGGTGPTPARGHRRWHRAAIPLATVAALFVITGVAYAIEQPDPADPAFLSPVSDADIGSRRLADRVRASGVEVIRQTRTADALDAADGGGATVLVPAPELLRRSSLRMLSLLPPGTRVVLVDPRPAAVHGGQLPAAAGARRWTAAVRDPVSGGDRCGLAEAQAAGPAAVTRQRYRATDPAFSRPRRCYDGGLLAAAWGRVEVVLVGAVDPFRNDRLGEHGNAALSTGLLTARPRLIWLDLHEKEPVPPPGEVTPDEPVVPGSRDGDSDSGDTGGGDAGNGNGDGGPAGDGGDPGTAQRGGQASGGGNPLLDAFPSWFWPVLTQLLLAALLFVLWRARRLGPPVVEPLPVTVRSAETVHGRGRLYHRAHARGPAFDTLRAAARLRLVALLGLPPDAPAEVVVAAVAQHSGRPEADVGELLYGRAPEDDEDLVRMASDLDTLTCGGLHRPHMSSKPPSTFCSE